MVIFFSRHLVRTVDLMKKGLRHAPIPFLRQLSQNRRPDEEGIKTLKIRDRCWQLSVRTVDLMKKGLRPLNAALLSAGEESEP